MQFNATPRFNFSSTPQPNPSQQFPASTPSASRYLTPARPAQRHVEIADTASDEAQDVHDSIETEERGTDILEDLSEEEDDPYKLEEPSQKRQRLSSSTDELDIKEVHYPDFQSSPPQVLSSPPISRRPVSSRAPRFIIASPAKLSIPRDSQTTFVKPPRFRPPEPLDQSQSQQDPLPDQFSPHRRGQKYVPGGLAAEVRDWLVNIESTAPTTGGHKVGLWLVKLVVEEVSGDSRTGMTMVKGSREEGGAAMKVLLAGEGEGTGLQKGAKVEVGKTVGIRGTVWDVVVEREKWGVSADWKVLL